MPVVQNFTQLLLCDAMLSCLSVQSPSVHHKMFRQNWWNS